MAAAFTAVNAATKTAATLIETILKIVGQFLCSWKTRWVSTSRGIGLVI
jgi:hypothetical protein